MKKELTYEVKRTLDWVQIKKNVYAFREELFHNDELQGAKEGIASLTELKKVMVSDPIQTLKKAIRGATTIHAALYKNEVREVVRTRPMGFDKVISDLRACLIEEPFTYIQEHGVEGLDIYYLHYGDHNMYDSEGVMLPKAMYFDYISPHMDNGYYDLEKALEVLKERSDIDWMGKPAEIKRIPSYNATYKRNRYLEFIWTPTAEDFDKVRPFIHDTFKRFDKVTELVFGLEQKPYDSCEDDSEEDED